MYIFISGDIQASYAANYFRGKRHCDHGEGATEMAG